MSIRFLHAADIHLDSPLKGLEQYEGAPTDEIRGATRRALENLVDLALERDVDFVLIAGDVYDGDWKDHNTGLFFVSQMVRLREQDIPVIMISGNHDAANRMTRSLRLPDNVELLPHARPRTAKTKKLRALGVAVHGQSFARAAEYGNLARDYPAKQGGLFNIGLLHTSLAGAEGHEPYAPCTVDELRQKEYDYWALGHVHNRELKCDDPHIVYCGNLQGRHIREAGIKGCYLVSLDERGRTDLRFHPLDVFRWEGLDVAADEVERADDVLELCFNRFSGLMTKHADIPLAVRLTVTGRSRAHEQLIADPIGWTSQIRAAALDAADGRLWIEKVRFRTSAAGELGDPAVGDGPIAELLRYLRELRGDEAQLLELKGELAELCRKLPDELLRGEDALGLDDPRRLRELLEDVQPLLVSRLEEGNAR